MPAKTRSKKVSAFAVKKAKLDDSDDATGKVDISTNSRGVQDGSKKRKPKQNRKKRFPEIDSSNDVSKSVGPSDSCIEISDDDGVTIKKVEPSADKTEATEGNKTNEKFLSITNTSLDVSSTTCTRQRKRSKSDPRAGGNVNKKAKTNKSFDEETAPDVPEEFNAEDEDSRNNIAAITTSNGVLVIAKHPVEFILKGRLKLQMLSGSASIMGYELVPSNEVCNIFSPTCNSLLTVKSIEGTNKEKKTLKKIDSLIEINDGRVMADLLQVLSDYKPCIVMRFQRLKSKLCSFVTKFSPYTNIFKIEGDRTDLNRQLLPLDAVIPRELDVEEMIVISDELQALLDLWMETLSQKHKEAPVMLVCGGKDSGKSTTNRMFLNSALNKLDRVYYLECDIGQTEFTPPGLVSLIEVTSPLFGPPFSHQQTPLCCYHFGGVTAPDNPDLYIHCISLCVQEYRRLKTSAPLVINCMGWMKGLGWQLLLDIVRITSPSHVIQLKARLQSQNIKPICLDSLYGASFTDLSQLYDGPAVSSKICQSPKIVNVETPFANSHQFKRNPQDHRNLSILSHLGSDLEPGLTLTSMTPYVVSWKDVAVRISHIEVSRTQVMNALNASLVALCEADISKAERFADDGPLFLNGIGPYKWVGYGIIRGIDITNKKFYVVTSLDEKQLSRVTLLEKSGIPVPENFLISQKCEKMLYVDEVVSSVGLSAVRPRKHMPRKGLSGFK